jgi:hypothetical protein
VVLVVVVVVVLALLELLEEEVVDVVEDVTVLESETAVMETVPELAVLFASPGYAASIVTDPAVAPVAEIEQLPVEPMMHVAGDVMLTLPVPPEG